MTEPATIRTVEHAEASDLPEINWFWRRTFVFALVAASAAHVLLTVRRIDDVAILHDVVRNDQILIALLAMLYIAGSSSEAITRLVGAVRTTRKETIAEGPAPAVVTPQRVEASEPAAAPPGAPDVPDKPAWER